MKDPSFSSFLNPDHSVVDQFDKNTVKDKQVVEVRTLYSMIGMLREEHSRYPQFISANNRIRLCDDK